MVELNIKCPYRNWKDCLGEECVASKIEMKMEAELTVKKTFKGCELIKQGIPLPVKILINEEPMRERILQYGNYGDE